MKRELRGCTVHPSDQLPDVFSEYFLNRVKLIRDDHDLQTLCRLFIMTLTLTLSLIHFNQFLKNIVEV